MIIGTIGATFPTQMGTGIYNALDDTGAVFMSEQYYKKLMLSNIKDLHVVTLVSGNCL